MPTYDVIETYMRLITVDAKDETEAVEKAELMPAEIADFEFQESNAILREQSTEE